MESGVARQFAVLIQGHETAMKVQIVGSIFAMKSPLHHSMWKKKMLLPVFNFMPGKYFEMQNSQQNSKACLLNHKPTYTGSKFIPFFKLPCLIHFKEVHGAFFYVIKFSVHRTLIMSI